LNSIGYGDSPREFPPWEEILYDFLTDVDEAAPLRID
jgi:hypothetical protein